MTISFLIQRFCTVIITILATLQLLGKSCCMCPSHATSVHNALFASARGHGSLGSTEMRLPPITSHSFANTACCPSRSYPSSSHRSLYQQALIYFGSLAARFLPAVSNNRLFNGAAMTMEKTRWHVEVPPHPLCFLQLTNQPPLSKHSLVYSEKHKDFLKETVIF